MFLKKTKEKSLKKCVLPVITAPEELHQCISGHTKEQFTQFALNIITSKFFASLVKKIIH